MRSPWQLRGGLAAFGKVDPNHARGIVRSGWKELFLRENGADRDGRGIGIDIKRARFFDLDDAVFLKCGESGLGYHVEDSPFAASAQAGSGSADGHDGHKAAGSENFHRGDIADRGCEWLGGIGCGLETGGGNFFDFEGLYIGHSEAGTGGGLGSE